MHVLSKIPTKKDVKDKDKKHFQMKGWVRL